MIPFSWWPGHWGLSGQTRELAKIDYEYATKPYKRACERAYILYTGDELKRKLLDLDYEYEVISKKEYDNAVIDMIEDEDERALSALDLLLADEEITQLEYDKELATLEQRPWFHFDVDYIDGELELSVDWNAGYIEFLRGVGYGNDTSSTEDDIINEYVRDFGRKISEDHPEDSNSDLGYSFIKTMRESDGTITAQ